MKVLKSWGASGQLVLSSPDAGALRNLRKEEPVFIEFDGLPVPFFIESCESKGSRFIVKFEDVDTLAEAEELVGRTVNFEEDGGGDADSWAGMLVRDNRSGKIIGEATGFNNFSGNTVVTVKTSEGEVLLPIHEDLITSIQDNTINLDIPEGLL